MDVFKTLILDTPTVEGATGTVTSVDLTAGTGISVSGGPITSSGSITVTNTSPDQTVALTGGTGISTSGTYPNFTITNDAPDQTVSIAAGTGISVTGSYPSFTVTNSSPSSGGDVVGPASATDNAVVRFDSTTGKLIQDSGVSISDANLLTTTALTVNDNTTLGSSNTDTVTFNARCASEFTPATDNTYDLGGTGHEWRDLYIDGTANIDSLVADTADVNGGTIDGATIGASTASSGAFTTLSASDDVNFDSGTLFVDASADSVGIGTTSPSSKLAVGGNPPTAGAIAGVGSSGGISLALSDNVNNSLYVKHVASSAATIGTDAGGQLAFATNGFTEAMRIDSSGNVGIGTTNPSAKLDVAAGDSASANGQAIISGGRNLGGNVAGGAGGLLFTNSYWSGGYGSAGIYALDTGSSGGGLVLSTTANGGGTTGTPAERMRIDQAGNVGIGTTSPAAKLDVVGDARISKDGAVSSDYSLSQLLLTGATSTNKRLALAFDTTNNIGLVQAYEAGGTVKPLVLNSAGGDVGIGTTPSTSAKLEVLGVSSGAIYGIQTYGPVYYAKENNTDNVGRGIFNFIRGSTLVGQIVTTNTTCAYNNVSDYRLKEITGPVVDSGKFIDALKPKVGTWKSDGSKFVGFLAHEFAEVSPVSVTGEKDAVNADGEPIYQSMQASTPEVMANIIAELQSLRARVAELEAKA